MNDLKIGWLSPTGELVECDHYEHLAVARRIVKQTGLNTTTHKAIAD